jgi:hypothetical protein
VLEILGEPLEAGSVIAGAYRLERVVGEGGMGVVWAAREIATGRAVALKFLREGHETDVRNQERVLREARATMAISHANIAKIEAVLETDAGVPFLVMELLEGESLRDLLRRRGSLTPIECARILLPVVDAVLAAHASHIVHRDLKPENVFIADGDRVRVLDFGIAKQLPKTGEAEAASLTTAGALIGTPIYMAPEQVFGDDDIDGSADVWSLGIIVYECLAAKRPTDGDGFGPVIKRITTETLEPLEQARAGLPRRITGVVGRMLMRDRAKRPPLVEVRAILASILEAGEGAVPSERPPDLATPISDRRAPAFVGSTTGGVASSRIASEAPPQHARGRRRAVALAAFGVMGVLVGALFITREKPKPSAAAALSPTGTARWAEASRLVHEATAAQSRRDGVTCLERFQSFDDLAVPGSGAPSTDPASGTAGARAICMMLVGRCEEGKALYRKWVAPWVGDSGMDLDKTIDAMAVDYCPGRDH